MIDGGYDEGYAATNCFWGPDPASLVKKFLTEQDVKGYKVLDLGCGEGKNAFAFANAGANVLAIDCSERAIQNGKSQFITDQIDWRIADASELVLPHEKFHVIVCYGLFHCFSKISALESVIAKIQDATVLGGYNIFCTFNERSQDLSAHPGFSPLLLRHSWYLERYASWSIEEASDTDLHETHPHNLIPHHHSLTRVIARKYGC